MEWEALEKLLKDIAIQKRGETVAQQLPDDARLKIINSGVPGGKIVFFFEREKKGEDPCP